MNKIKIQLTIAICFFLFYSCRKEALSPRSDGATRLAIDKKGSMQNPAFLSNNQKIIFTRFLEGYNSVTADLMIYDLTSGNTKTLVADGSANVNLPGSSWNPITKKIVFASSREPHDEIYMIDENGNPGNEIKVTNRNNQIAYEPTFSPDGQWIVFESHKIDVENQGVIVKYKVDIPNSYTELTDAAEDCRQPNWSPAGETIVYQKFENGHWSNWIMNSNGTNKIKVTSGTADATDASFSPDGKYIVYSSNQGGEKIANIYIISVSGGVSKRVTNYEGYDGAPSWSADGKKIIFESSSNELDKPSLWAPYDSRGTSIWIIDSPI
ncbi:MAG: hypothetical protein ABIO44_11915 [Saprospiraceae bacterium]